MKIKYFFAASAIVALLASCAKEEFTPSIAPDSVAQGELMEVDENFSLAFTTNDGTETKSDWTMLGGATPTFWLRWLPKGYLTPGEDATNSTIVANGTYKVIAPEIGVCYYKGGSAVETNYLFLHNGWLKNGEARADFDECFHFLRNGWTYTKDERGRELPAPALGGFYVDGVDPTDPSTTDGNILANAVNKTFATTPDLGGVADINYTSGVFKTTNLTLFKGEYIAYYPFNKEYVEELPIRANTTTVFGDAVNIWPLGAAAAMADPRLADNTFSYTSVFNLNGGQDVAGLGFHNLSGLVQLQLSVPAADLADGRIINKIALTSKEGFYEEVSLDAAKIKANQTGTNLYMDAPKAKKAKTMLIYNAPLTLGTVAQSVVVSALPAQLTNVKVYLFDDTNNEVGVVNLGNVEFKAGVPVALSVVAENANFSDDLYAIDFPTLQDALNMCWGADHTITLLNDIEIPENTVIPGGATIRSASVNDPINNVEPEKLIVLSHDNRPGVTYPYPTVTLQVNDGALINSPIDLMGEDCCSACGNGARLYTHDATFNAPIDFVIPYEPYLGIPYTVKAMPFITVEDGASVAIPTFNGKVGCGNESYVNGNVYENHLGNIIVVAGSAAAFNEDVEVGGMEERNQYAPCLIEINSTNVDRSEVAFAKNVAVYGDVVVYESANVQFKDITLKGRTSMNKLEDPDTEVLALNIYIPRPGDPDEPAQRTYHYPKIIDGMFIYADNELDPAQQVFNTTVQVSGTINNYVDIFVFKAKGNNPEDFDAKFDILYGGHFVNNASENGIVSENSQIRVYGIFNVWGDAANHGIVLDKISAQVYGNILGLVGTGALYDRYICEVDNDVDRFPAALLNSQSSKPTNTIRFVNPPVPADVTYDMVKTMDPTVKTTINRYEVWTIGQTVIFNGANGSKTAQIPSLAIIHGNVKLPMEDNGVNGDYLTRFNIVGEDIINPDYCLFVEESELYDANRTDYGAVFFIGDPTDTPQLNTPATFKYLNRNELKVKIDRGVAVSENTVASPLKNYSILFGKGLKSEIVGNLTSEGGVTRFDINSQLYVRGQISYDEGVNNTQDIGFITLATSVPGKTPGIVYYKDFVPQGNKYWKNGVPTIIGSYIW